MTKIEVLRSQNSPQSQIDIVFDRLLSYIQNCTKEEIENVLNEMRHGHQPEDITLIQGNILQDLGVAINDSRNDNDPVSDDSVNHPNHYNDGNIEVIDFIEDKNLDFHLGNAIKYISRAGKKHEQGMSNKQKEINDLRKAMWYINRKIDQLKSEGKDEN